LSARKTERLMNLLILLLSTRTYLPKHKLRESLEEYRAAPSDEAFEKMFERDKEELRALGVPVEVGSYDPLFDDEQGYRISRAEFELPEIHLSADEAAVVGLAARVWKDQELAATTQDALRKLAADGVDVDPEAQSLIAPQLVAEEPSFLTFLDAATTRRPVRFGYRSSTSAAGQERRVEPWGVVGFRGRWYAVGLDRDRGEHRVFRLGRVEGEVSPDGPPGSFDVPADLDLKALSSHLAPEVPDREAVLLVRSGRAVPLRRRATATDPARDGWDLVRVPFGRVDTLVAEVCELGDAVVVLEPDDIRDEVLWRLRSVADPAAERAQP
jgi:proteasome accessory factor B